MPKKNNSAQDNKKKDGDALDFNISEANNNLFVDEIGELDLDEDLKKIDGSFLDDEEEIYEDADKSKKQEGYYLKQDNKISDSVDVSKSFDKSEELDDSDELDDSEDLDMSDSSYSSDMSDDSIDLGHTVREVVYSQTPGQDQEVVLHFYKDDAETVEKKIQENAQDLVDLLDKKLKKDNFEDDSFYDIKVGKNPEQYEVKAEPAYYEEVREFFSDLDKERQEFKLDSFMSNDTDEYKEMKKSYENLRELQNSNGSSAKELADAFNKLQEKARDYLEKKSTQKQNTRRTNRMNWAKRIVEADNRYALPAAYDVVEKLKYAGSEKVKKAFGNPISREELGKGVAMHIVANILDKQIASDGSNLNYDDLQLITASNRIEYSINSFVGADFYKNFIADIPDKDLRKIYTISEKEASENEEDLRTDAEMFSERLYNRLLIKIKEMNSQTANAEPKEKTSVKEGVMAENNISEKNIEDNIPVR